MKKELIYMGHSNGMVRLALFDPADGGVARKLPFKEVTVDLFVRGIKSGKMPVRGFGVKKGRITCKYGDWYSLPEVGNAGALSLFGSVCILTEDDTFAHCTGVPWILASSKPLRWLGVASVDWNDGMFRVVAMSTLHWFAKFVSDKVMYQYGGAWTKARLRKKIQYNGDGDEIPLKDYADYIFPECDASEDIHSVAEWMHCRGASNSPFLQWVFQKCEIFAVSSGNTYAEESMLDADCIERHISLALMGKRPLHTIEGIESIYNLGLMKGRSVEVVKTKSNGTFNIYASSIGYIECPNLRSLELAYGTRVKLLRDKNSERMTVSHWDGWEGSDGDYTGLNIDTMCHCFTKKVYEPEIVVDVSGASSCFNDIDAHVKIINHVTYFRNCFLNFKGEIEWQGGDTISNCFEGCEFTAPLDIRQVRGISDSVNRIKGEILHKDAYTYLDRAVFCDTHITRIKYTPSDGGAAGIMLQNKSLSVDIKVDSKEGTLFSNVILGGMIFSTNSCEAPRFNKTSCMPEVPVLETTRCQNNMFENCEMSLLDMRKFPNLTTIPTAFANKCKFTTVIFGEKTETIRDRVFIDCDMIRWVYISSAAKDVGTFIKRPRIPYTIYTQKGSAAEKYGKKYGIEVRYAQDGDEFLRLIRVVPEDLQGAVAVSRLMGENDGEASALKIACEYADIYSDLYNTCTVKEHCNVPIGDVAWINKSSVERASSSRGDSGPRSHMLISHVSKEAPFNPDVLSLTESKCLYGSTWYKAGDYVIGYREMSVNGNMSYLAWAILKNNIVIHAFTEKVSSTGSGGAFAQALSQAHDSDSAGARATSICNVLEFTNFTGNGGYVVHGKKVPSSISSLADRSLLNTVTPIGVYQTGKNKRSVIGVDMTNLNFWEFRLAAGKSLDTRKSRYRYRETLWVAIREVIGSAAPISDIGGLTRLYSEFGGADDALRILLGHETDKVEEFDTSYPESEIDAIKSLYSVLDAHSRGIDAGCTCAELAQNLQESGWCRRISSSGWSNLRRRMYHRSVKSVGLSDGLVDMYCGTDITVFSVKAPNIPEQTFICGAEYSDLLDYIPLIVSSFSTAPTYTPVDRVEHFSLVNCVLPLNEFIILREFSSGGTYPNWAGSMLSVYVLLSKISGKPCVACVTGGDVIPYFWTNRIADAFRVAELCGLNAFSYDHEWMHQKYNSLCSGIASSAEQIKDGNPDFNGIERAWKETREALQRGENDGYLCVLGNQQIFDLCVKHPAVNTVS